MEEGGDLSELQWGDSPPPRTSSRPSSGAATLTRADRSGRGTPASVDSIPLEWDHDYDLSRDLESAVGQERRTGQEQEDEYLRTATTVLSGLSTLTDFYGRWLRLLVDVTIIGSNWECVRMLFSSSSGPTQLDLLFSLKRFATHPSSLFCSESVVGSNPQTKHDWNCRQQQDLEWGESVIA